MRRASLSVRLMCLSTLGWLGQGRPSTLPHLFCSRLSCRATLFWQIDGGCILSPLVLCLQVLYCLLQPVQAIAPFTLSASYVLSLCETYGLAKEGVPSTTAMNRLAGLPPAALPPLSGTVRLRQSPHSLPAALCRTANKARCASAHAAIRSATNTVSGPG